MKNKKRFLIGMLSSFMLAATVGGAVACKDDDKPKAPGYDETGIYYVDVNNEEYVLSLSGNAFTLLVNNETQTGTYKYDGDNVNFKFKDVKTPVVGDLDETDGTLTMEINGIPYRFFKKVSYNVSFVTNCDETIAPVKVTNGRKVNQPADPYKDGHVFLGWYSDAAFTTAFAFDAMPITKDTTLYALFVKDEAGQDEFVADFYVDGEWFDYRDTVNGAVVNMPTPEVTGKTFLGWWYSDTNDAEKLTAKYEGQKLAANTAFFAVFASDAPAVSVNKDGVKWSAKAGANNTYFVTITNPADEKVVDNESVGAEAYAFDFATKAAGEYKVEVTLNGKTTTVYYANKTLDRVSVFMVAEPSVLVFNPVANAEKYIVSYTCGDEAHTHEAFDIGKSTYFNFANCKIPVEGITFTVTAVAKGYASSVSEEFHYYRDLAAVSNVVVENDTLVWDSVYKATAYDVFVDGAKVATVKGNSYSFKALPAGNYTVAVQAVAPTYNSMDATEVAYTKTTLAAPTVSVNGKVVTWAAVDGATKYVVKVGDTSAEVTEGTTYTIPDTAFVDGVEVYDVTVEAVAADAANNAVSDVVALYKATMSELTYDKGVLSWAPVANATRYEVAINSATYNVMNANTFDVTFTRGGANELKVRAVIGDSVSDWARLSVYAYTINFEGVLVGASQHPTMYKALGDPFNPGTVTKKGYEFVGWYNLPGGSQNNAMKYDSPYFETAGNLTLFAGWKSVNAYKAYFVYGYDEHGAELYFEKEMFYGEEYKVDPVENEDATQGFVGWYYEGTRLTDEFGNGLTYWPYEREITVYAEYVEVLSFQEILAGDGTDNTVWQVLKGSEIGQVKHVKIPAEYKGKAVTTIASLAFEGCENLESISFPDTIKEITIPVEGANGAGSAFIGCYELKKLEMYCVNEADHARHESPYTTTEDGMLLRTAEGITDIEFTPFGLTDTLTIPYGVTRVNVKRVTNTQCKRIEIPASVTVIESRAFMGNTNLTELVFLPTPEGEEVVPLTINDEAFHGCDALKTVKVPARLASISGLAFKYCDLLETFEAEEGGSFVAKDGVLCANEGKEIVIAPKALKPNRDDGVFEIPAGVETIKKNAFYLNSIKKLHIPGFVETIEDEAFSYVVEMESLTFEESDVPLTIGAKAFFRNLKVTTVTLPERLESLGTNAFGQINVLSTVVVNMKDPTQISPSAFAGNVKNLTIGKTAGAFGVAAVFGNSVVNLTIEEGNEFFSRDAKGVLFDKDQTQVSYVPLSVGGDYSLPDTVVTIGENIFKGNTNLTKITIGAKVETIGASAFNGCKNLTEVVFDGGTANLSIGASAFVGTKLEKFEVPMTRGEFVLGANALQNVTTLTTVKLPATVAQLGSVEGTTFVSPFSGCGNLTNFAIGENNVGGERYKYVDGMVFEYVEGVQKAIVFALRKAMVGTDGVVTVPNTVTAIYSDAFYKNETLKAVNFVGEMPDMQFGANAFSYATKLETFTFPEGMTTIGEKMFAQNTSLKKIVVPGSVTSIGSKFATDCPALTEIEFKDGTETLILTTAKDVGFIERCNALQTFNIPSRVTTLPYLLLLDCKGLTTVNVPASITTFAANGSSQGTSAQSGKTGIFCGCTSLTNLNFAVDETTNKVKFTEIPAQAFANSGPLELVIPEGVTKVKEFAFAGEAANGYLGIKSVSFPSTLTEIGKYAFSYGTNETLNFNGATALKKIGNYAFNNSKIASLDLTGATALTSIGTYAFASVKNTYTSVVIPVTVTTISESAFSNQKKLSTVTFATYPEGNENEGKSELKTIGKTAFASSGITALNLPETVKPLTLGDSMVNNCKYLRTVHLPSQVSTVLNKLLGCPWIETFTFAENSPLQIEGSYIVKKADSTIQHTWKEVTDTEFVVSTESVGEGVFKGAPFKKITIKNTVKTIGAYAFQGCLDLEEVVFEEGCEIIWAEKNEGMFPGTFDIFTNKAFQGCTSLKKVTLASTMTSVGISAFEGCSVLDELTYHGCASTEKFNLPDNFDLPNGKGFLWGEPNDEYCTPGAFAGTAFTKIKLPASMTEIGVNAFMGCDKLETIEIGDAVATIRNGAFNGCKSLKKLELPANLSRIDGSAFRACSKLTEIKVRGKACADNEVTLPDGVIELLGSTFYGCMSVTKINLPENIERIDEYEFYGTGITSITIPAKIITIPSYAFGECEDLQEVNVLGGIEEIGDKAFQNCTSLTYFDPVTEMSTIGNGAFMNSGLKSVMIRVTSANKVFDYDAFRGCQNLEKVYISDHVKSLGYWRMSGSKDYTFAECPNLKTMGLILPNGKLFETENTITLPSGLLHIGLHTFENSGIERVVINEGLSLGSEDRYGTGDSFAFKDCKQLVSVIFPQNLKASAIGNSVFEGCTALESVSLPSTLVSIGSNCFKGSGLTSVEIPTMVETIGNDAFALCTNLENINVNSANVKFSSVEGVLYNADATQMITYPAGKPLGALAYPTGTVKSYAYAKNAGLTSVVIPEGVTSLPEGVFMETGITEITIPASVTSIGANAFKNCKSLTTVTFAEGSKLSSIGANAFANTALTAISLPNGVTAISDFAFANTKLTSFATPANVTTIGLGAFENCASLATLTFAEGSKLTTIGGKAIAGTLVSSIALPVGVNTLYSQKDETGATVNMGAFVGATNLTTVTFAADTQITSIPKYAFKDSAITSIVIPATVTEIGQEAFRNCTALTTVTFAAGCKLEKLGTYAFANTAITSFTNIEHLVTINSSAFANCANLEGDFNFTDTLETISSAVFMGCTKINSIKIPYYAAVSTSAFSGWTATQTINIETKQWFAQQKWTKGWDNKCEAKIVWNYQAPAANA